TTTSTSVRHARNCASVDCSAPASPRRRCGCSTGNDNASAACFTGLAVSTRPRPAGRSGWVRTPTTSWAAASACSAGTAKAGVPAKATRNFIGIGRLQARLGWCRAARAATAVTPLLLELAADALALELRQVVDEQLAVQVVHLVLQAHGEQVGEVLFVRGTVGILIANAHALRALDVVIDAGHRQAAFLAFG